ncbi:MAG: ABC transporter permease subunit [Deinococcus sp.]|nr:ABC transporter permease subunit [Deinococcus sp.]
MVRVRSSSLMPMLVVAIVVAVLYVPLMVAANYGPAKRALERGAVLDCPSAFACSFQLRSPVIPAPGQLIRGVQNLSWPPLSPTAIPYNAAFTAMETLVGLLLASLVGLFFAVGLVASRPFEKSLLPWLVASQTIPIIAIAPMLAVLLGQYGVQGWVPKAIIAAYIAFFPITIGVAKGLRSPEPLALDLMKTYNSTDLQTYAKLRFPASLPYLFTAFKVSMAAALIGSIIGEISTISFQGLGRMLSENSRASDVVALWVIMLASSLLGIFLVALVGWIEKVVSPWRLGR